MKNIFVMREKHDIMESINGEDSVWIVIRDCRCSKIPKIAFIGILV